MKLSKQIIECILIIAVFVGLYLLQKEKVDKWIKKTFLNENNEISDIRKMLMKSFN